jgi:hypothetical protein
LPPADTLNPILGTQEITLKYMIKTKTHKKDLTTDFITQQHKMKCPDNIQYVSSQESTYSNIPSIKDRKNIKTSKQNEKKR